MDLKLLAVVIGGVVDQNLIFRLLSYSSSGDNNENNENEKTVI